MTMTLSGSGTITGLTPGGLPDASVTQPDLASGVAGTGPAFSAYQSTIQTGLSQGVANKIAFQSKSFDTANCYDSTTNYRFTPNVSGYYYINASISAAVSSYTYVCPSIYKNGSAIMTGPNSSSAGPYSNLSVSYLVYLNGTTDYIEIYFTAFGAGAYQTYSGIGTTSVQGYLTRST